MRTLGQLVDFN